MTVLFGGKPASLTVQPLLPAAALVALVVLAAACGDKSFAGSCKTSDKQQFDEPADIIDAERPYVATITTEKGDITVELFSDVPVTTNNFVFLACKGFYNGLTFHAVIPGFSAEAGDPTATGTGGPGYTIPDEDDGDHTFETGVISMAKVDPNAAGSRFFITYTPQPSLEADFAVFGRVIAGMDVLRQLTPRDPAQNPDAPPGDVIETITIEER